MADDAIWMRILAYLEHQVDQLGLRIDQDAKDMVADLRRWCATIAEMPILDSFDADARDDNEPCVVPRSMLRRVLADLELLRGSWRGYAQVAGFDGILEMPAHEDGRTLRVRLEATDRLAAAVMVAGHITEDEDLDD